MDVVTARVKRSRKRQLKQVADGLLKVYRTLVRMRYLEDEWIHEGPHDMTDLLPLCEKLGIDDSIVYLYSILPYVNTHHAEGVDFYQRGDFIDFRDKSEIRQGRDPMYADNEREAMRPWMTPLSAIGNHDTALIYDARRHVIGMFDQMSYGSNDPAFHAEELPGGLPDWMLEDRKEQDDGSSDEAESEPDESDEAECESDESDGGEDLPDDENIWDDMDARPAREVLRGMVHWYEALVEVPGGGERSGREMRPELTKPLYIKHGWPGPDFDGDAFVVDRLRAEAARSARYGAEEPLRKAHEMRSRIRDGDTPAMKKAKETMAKAKDPEEEWLARWRLWQAEFEQRDVRRQARELGDVAERKCPGGQCIKPGEEAMWELKDLERGLEYHRWSLARRRKEAEEAGGPEKAPKPHLICLAHEERCMATYEKACAACRIEAGGKTMPVSRAVDELGLDLDETLESSARELRNAEIEVEATRGWLAEVPEGVKKARAEAEKLLKRYETNVDYFRGQLQKYAKDQSTRLE